MKKEEERYFKIKDKRFPLLREKLDEMGIEYKHTWAKEEATMCIFKDGEWTPTDPYGHILLRMSGRKFHKLLISLFPDTKCTWDK